MNTHDIELPPLPSPFGIVDPDGTEGLLQYTNRDLQDYAKSYAIAAIEADRKTTAKQLSAYESLVASLEAKCTHMRKMYDELKDRTNPDLLASERAANAILTAELEAAREQHTDWHRIAAELLRTPQPAEPIAMSLDDAIAHAVAIAADGSTPCQRQHMQLAAWLRELREFRCTDQGVPRVEFDDPRVQLVYKIICGDNHPPEGEHWDGYVSRLIVDALFHDEPTFTTPDCRDCGCVQDGQCLCNPSKPPAEPVSVPSDEKAAHDNWYSRTHMHEDSREATWRGWQARALLARYGAQPAEPVKQCGEIAKKLTADQIEQIIDAYIAPDVMREALRTVENAPWLLEPVKGPSDADILDLATRHEHGGEAGAGEPRLHYFRDADVIELVRSALASYGNSAQPLDQDDPCEHSEHVRPTDGVCVECGEIVGRHATPAPPSNDEIREVLLKHGYTIKPGHHDLKPYVYAAAQELIDRYGNASRTHTTFKLGDRVRKIKGSNWTGRVVGTYSTTLTPEGYAVESETERGSVQIYPMAALELIVEADHA